MSVSKLNNKAPTEVAEASTSARISHESQYSGWKECPFCKYIFSNNYNRDRHIQSYHIQKEEASTFKCDLCTKIYKRKDTLRAHLRNKHGEPGVLTFRPPHLMTSVATQTIELPVTVPETPREKIEMQNIGMLKPGKRRTSFNPVVGTPTTSTLATSNKSVRQVLADLRMAAQIDFATKTKDQRRSDFISSAPSPGKQLAKIEALHRYAPYERKNRVAHSRPTKHHPVPNDKLEEEDMITDITPTNPTATNTAMKSPMEIIMEATGMKSDDPITPTPTPTQKVDLTSKSSLSQDLLLSEDSSSDSSSESDSDSSDESDSDMDSQSEKELIFDSIEEKNSWNNWILSSCNIKN